MGMGVGGGKGPRSDINITPLVDVVLVLLIIFMVLTPLMEKQMSVRVPEDEKPVEPTPPPPPDVTQMVLKVKDDGRVVMNGEQLSPDTMVERLKVYYRLAKAQEQKAGPPVVFFDADDKTKYSAAMKALDAVRESSDKWTIGMMTESIKDAAPEAPGAPGAPGAPAPGGAPAPAAPATPEAPK